MDADRETLERPHRKAVPREMAQSPRPQHQQIAMDRRRGPPPGPGTRSVWQSVGKNCQTSTWQVHRPIPLHSTPHCDFFTIAVSLFQQSGCNSARSFFFFFLAICLFIPLFFLLLLRPFNRLFWNSSRNVEISKLNVFFSFEIPRDASTSKFRS